MTDSTYNGWTNYETWAVRGSACVFVYDDRTMSGEVDDVSSCGITVYGREDGRRYLVGSQNVRRETAVEQDRRERLGYYTEDPS